MNHVENLKLMTGLISVHRVAVVVKNDMLAYLIEQALLEAARVTKTPVTEKDGVYMIGSDK